MFRALHWISTSLLIALAILSTRGPVPAAPRERTLATPAKKAPAKEAPAAAAPAKTEDWYEPQEDHFKLAYHDDPANKAKQPWREYWGWVKSFYAGNFLDSGWTKRCKDLVSAVQNEQKQSALRAKLNALGRCIAAEWAKSNSQGKVDSSKLMTWGARLLEAKNKDTGAGEVIQKEIELIAKEAGDGI
jgi:hypothetical protein